MSISYCDKFILFTMLTLDSNMTMEGLDLAIPKDVLLSRTSRTASFTISSSSSSSTSSCLQQDNLPIIRTPRASFDIHITENPPTLKHSQSLTLECFRRRPIIEDPYQLTPNLQVLNNWMITTTGKSRRELSEVHGFSEEQIAVFEESFSLLDKDGDGNITNSEIRSLMNSLGYSPREEDISSVISKIDIDGNGSVDFDEFLTMMRRRKSTGESDTELQQVFNVFDKNKDGFIDHAELNDMLSRLGERITEEDVTEMIEEADCLDNDGKVSYEEFKAILYSK